MPKENATQAPLRCSFCGRSEREARNLIVQGNACICDTCIKTCNEIIARDQLESPESPERLLAPQEIKEKLDEYFSAFSYDLMGGDRERSYHKLYRL